MQKVPKWGSNLNLKSVFYHEIFSLSHFHPYLFCAFFSSLLLDVTWIFGGKHLRDSPNISAQKKKNPARFLKHISSLDEIVIQEDSQKQPLLYCVYLSFRISFYIASKNGISGQLCDNGNFCLACQNIHFSEYNSTPLEAAATTTTTTKHTKYSKDREIPCVGSMFELFPIRTWIYTEKITPRAPEKENVETWYLNSKRYPQTFFLCPNPV